MPQSYYTLSSSNQIIIPPGEVNAGIEVQLTDEFFNDPLALKLAYVIPIRIVSVANLDSVLRGKPSLAVQNLDPRITANWQIVPKDFTMFAVKYINPYHGKYLHHGVSVVKNAASATLETTPYRARYVEQNEIWSLVSSVQASGVLRSEIITGTLVMELTFSGDGNCTINEAVGSKYTITGSGKFVNDSESWEGEKHDTIYLNYQLTSDGNTYSATDTLVIRDRGVKMEVFEPRVILP
jgi:hypothetical protein